MGREKRGCRNPNPQSCESFQPPPSCWFGAWGWCPAWGSQGYVQSSACFFFFFFIKKIINPAVLAVGEKKSLGT